MFGLAKDYTRELVGKSSGRCLWILSRTAQFTPGLKVDLVSPIDAMGYNIKALYWTLLAGTAASPRGRPCNPGYPISSQTAGGRR